MAKMNAEKLAAWERKRDLNAELLEAIREVKTGHCLPLPTDTPAYSWKPLPRETGLRLEAMSEQEYFVKNGPRCPPTHPGKIVREDVLPAVEYSLIYAALSILSPEYLVDPEKPLFNGILTPALSDSASRRISG